MNKQAMLGIDYGTRKTGIAYSVEGFAFAWKTVPTKTLISVIKQCIQEKHSVLLVVGMPYNIDGTLSLHGRRVQAFVKNLQKEISIPIVLYDERLTTSEARIGFVESGFDGDVDAEAARLILESYAQGEK